MLARKSGQRPVLISDIAQRELIPRKFLKLILLELRHTAILQSRKGKDGGYFLAWEPAHFMLGEILRVVEDSLGPYRVSVRLPTCVAANIATRIAAGSAR
jgi:Rrf2 family protein